MLSFVHREIEGPINGLVSKLLEISSKFGGLRKDDVWSNKNIFQGFRFWGVYQGVVLSFFFKFFGAIFAAWLQNERQRGFEFKGCPAVFSLV